MGVQRARAAEAGADAPADHRDRRQQVRGAGEGPARQRPRSASGRAFRQPAGLLHVCGGYRASAQRDVQPHGGGGAPAANRVRSPMASRSSAPCSTAAGWGSRVSTGSTAVCSTTTSALPLSRPRDRAVARRRQHGLVGDRPLDHGHAVRARPRPGQAQPARCPYTDGDKIMKIIEPVIKRQLEAEWAETKGKIEALLARSAQSAACGVRTTAREDGEKLYKGFLERLRSFRVLDPACGSGNFLYLALQTLKNLEHRVGIELEALESRASRASVGPEQLLGIEINPYAAELAASRSGSARSSGCSATASASPGIRSCARYDTIDAATRLLNEDGTRPSGRKSTRSSATRRFSAARLLSGGLGEAVGRRVCSIAMPGACPPEADLVCYWYAKDARGELRPAARSAPVSSPRTR